MKNFAKKYPFTCMAIAASGVLTALNLVLNLEIWEELVKLIAKGEDFELDEFIIPAFLLMMGVTGDAVLQSKDAKHVDEKVGLYNQMNDEIMNEISAHLTKLLEFRTALKKDAPNAHDARHELDRMIVKSFNHYERTQRRGNIDSNLMDLVENSSTPPAHSQPPISSSPKPTDSSG
jgi:hypothetical protein